MARNCLPIDSGKDANPIRTLWLPAIVNDPVLCQAATNFAAVHLDILQNQQYNPKTLMRKSRTIRMINSKLQSPREATTNTMIGAVALLAAMEVRFQSCGPLNKRVLSGMG